MEARHKHHRSDCNFLGQWDNFDLYYCPSEDTLMARFGNEIGDFSAGTVDFIVQRRGMRGTDDARALQRACVLYTRGLLEVGGYLKKK